MRIARPSRRPAEWEGVAYQDVSSPAGQGIRRVRYPLKNRRDRSTLIFISPHTERPRHHPVDREPQVNAIRREVQKILPGKDRRELPCVVVGVLAPRANPTIPPSRRWSCPELPV